MFQDKLINVIHSVYRMKDKNHMINSIQKNHLTKLTSFYYKKNSQETRHRKKVPQHNKGHI